MNGRWSFRAAIVAASLVALLAVSGCGLLVQKGVEAATGVKVDQGTGQVTVTGKNGQTATSQEGKIPDGLPADFPVYQGTVKLGNKVTTPQGTTFQIVIETADGAKTIGDWYENKLKAADWKADWIGFDKPHAVELPEAPFGDAKWIWHAADGETPPKCHRLFVSEFALPENIIVDKAEMLIA